VSFGFGCENGEESNDKMRGGDIEARVGREGDEIAISGSTM
jgi:hypothetical protein